MNQTKTCTKCNQTKLLSEFHTEKRGKYGKTSRCKICVNQLSKNHYWVNSESTLNNNNSKKCNKCNEIKLLIYFPIHRGCKDGRKGYCNTCKSIQDAEYRKNNKDKIKQHQKEYYNANKENFAQKSKAYREANKDIKRIKDKEYREANKDKLSLTKKQYLATPKGKAVKKASHQKRKLILRNVIGKYNAGDIMKLFELQSSKCIYCKKELDSTIREGYHIDHIIPLNKNGTNNPDNLQLLCPTCNCSKQDKLPEEFAQQFGMLL